MTRPISVVLADDHAIVRHGLRLLLESEADIAVIGETADGLEVAALIERLAPDVLILDILMPGLSGLDVTKDVTRRSPATRILILSMLDSDSHVLEALRCGATGYIAKGSAPPDLVRAVRAAAVGRRYLRPGVPESTIEEYLHRVRGADGDVYDLLTRRQREVLHLTAEGLSSTAIALRLGISARTAEAHRAGAMRRLGLKGLAELIRYSLSRGLGPRDVVARPRDPQSGAAESR